MNRTLKRARASGIRIALLVEDVAAPYGQRWGISIFSSFLEDDRPDYAIAEWAGRVQAVRVKERRVAA